MTTAIKSKWAVAAASDTGLPTVQPHQVEEPGDEQTGTEGQQVANEPSHITVSHYKPAPSQYLIINIKMSTLERDPTWTTTELETFYDALLDIQKARKDLHDGKEALCEHYRKDRDRLFSESMAFLARIVEHSRKLLEEIERMRTIILGDDPPTQGDVPVGHEDGQGTT
ncbi:hypothetical protein J4E83_003788 [Alternaria metachromatica]|uniref:uncharacterized protein n=1 Tax=Alternaria metachromatica TaxID=283354 RepID=UPI0020C507A5|nr:uncharacterized protein J4E83_003788 [Alternaria metachromatica]KAI4626636.1 hypothetical protein J4E83_003788 [Alternaria metachromatica]